MAHGYCLVQTGSNGEPVLDEDGLPSPSGPIIVLPDPVWGRGLGKDRTGIKFVTELGRRYVFRQFRRRKYRFPFLLLPDELEILRTLDEAVDGDADPFLYVPDVDASPIEFIFVRKVEGNFDEGRESPVLQNGVTRLVECELAFDEEPTGREILI